MGWNYIRIKLEDHSDDSGLAQFQVGKAAGNITFLDSYGSLCYAVERDVWIYSNNSLIKF